MDWLFPVENHEPLFAAGFYDLNIEELEQVFIEPFLKTERRFFLLKQFIKFLKEMSSVGASFEIWVDGSFATKKENPNDIDIAIFYSPEQIDSLPEEQANMLLLLADHDETKIRYNCDIYLIPDNDVELRSYWRGWFGFSRDETTKGIPRIKVGSKGDIK